MKKSLLLLLCTVLVLWLLGAQAFASPPVKPPPEGFIITSNTTINCQGDVRENERYNWQYFEGWGKGPFYPNAYKPVACTGCEGAVSELGFTQGAEIAYEQTFTALKGSTSFTKSFKALSHPDAAAGEDNLNVHKEIDYTADDPAVGYAEHTEKVGLSVISMGKAGDDGIADAAASLLTLCPWAAQSGGSAYKGYPATNEGIAAGSHFKVTQIQGFVSDSRVNSTVNPMLSYNVTALSGTGLIEAGFVVELWEAPEDFVWAPLQVTENGVPTDPECYECGPCQCNPRSSGECYILPEAFGAPPLASRTSYKEYASADGTWSFTKNVKYESVMPAGAASSTFPINQVLVP